MKCVIWGVGEGDEGGERERLGGGGVHVIICIVLSLPSLLFLFYLFRLFLCLTFSLCRLLIVCCIYW